MLGAFHDKVTLQLLRVNDNDDNHANDDESKVHIKDGVQWLCSCCHDDDENDNNNDAINVS